LTAVLADQRVLPSGRRKEKICFATPDKIRTIDLGGVIETELGFRAVAYFPALADGESDDCVGTRSVE
jgi:hypothetical protein